MVCRSGEENRGPRGRWSMWQVVAAMPAMLASAGVMLVLLGGAGRWEPAAMLAWLLVGSWALSRPGERVAVRLACRFRRLSPADAALLAPVWREVCLRCGVPAGTVDLYVQHSRGINAYTVGSRSVAVTSRVVASYRAGAITADMLRGILAHELGHQVTRGTRLTLVTLWLAAPWRVFSRTTVAVCARVAGPQPVGALLVAAGAAFGIAIGQGARAGQWGTVAVLSALVAFAVVTPLADAAISRASERAADRFAAHVGFGTELALALAALGTGHRHRILGRLLERHPCTSRRLDDLAAQAEVEETDQRASGLLAV